MKDEDYMVLYDVATHVRRHAPLPLHLAVTLAGGGLERLWADNDDPLEMLEILWKTGRILVPGMAMRALRMALHDLPEAQGPLDQLESIFDRESSEFLWWTASGNKAAVALGDSLAREEWNTAPGWRTDRVQLAQALMRRVLRDVLTVKRGGRGGLPSSQLWVRDVISVAMELKVSRHALSQMILDHYPDPPTIEEIVAVTLARRE